MPWDPQLLHPEIRRSGTERLLRHSFTHARAHVSRCSDTDIGHTYPGSRPLNLSLRTGIWTLSSSCIPDSSTLLHLSGARWQLAEAHWDACIPSQRPSRRIVPALQVPQDERYHCPHVVLRTSRCTGWARAGRGANDIL